MGFAGPEFARFELEKMGNPASGKEAGIVFAGNKNERWFIVFQYLADGHVNDDQHTMDADALLASLQASNVARNEERKKVGAKTGQLKGWYEDPHYDSRTHTLRWAVMAAQDGGDEWVNYKAIIFGRVGMMVLTVIESPDDFPKLKPKLEEVLTGFSFTKGNAYGDWQIGDREAASSFSDFIAPGGTPKSAGVFATIGRYITNYFVSVHRPVNQVI